MKTIKKILCMVIATVLLVAVTPGGLAEASTPANNGENKNEVAAAAPLTTERAGDEYWAINNGTNIPLPYRFMTISPELDGGWFESVTDPCALGSFYTTLSEPLYVPPFGVVYVRSFEPSPGNPATAVQITVPTMCEHAEYWGIGYSEETFLVSSELTSNRFLHIVVGRDSRADTPGLAGVQVVLFSSNEVVWIENTGIGQPMLEPGAAAEVVLDLHPYGGVEWDRYELIIIPMGR